MARKQGAMSLNLASVRRSTRKCGPISQGKWKSSASSPRCSRPAPFDNAKLHAFVATADEPMLGEPIAQNWRSADLPDRETSMRDFAVKRTEAPDGVEEGCQAAREAGFSDRHICDIAAVTAFDIYLMRADDVAGEAAREADPAVAQPASWIGGGADKGRQWALLDAPGVCHICAAHHGDPNTASGCNKSGIDTEHA
jgi:hypothetical protein